MNPLARRFVRRILLVHLLLLAALGVALAVAARLVYNSFRDEAIRSVQGRQHLLAIQTTRGIENDYQSILSALELMGRWNSHATTAPAGRLESLTPLLWEQLRDKASHLFVIDTRSMTLLGSFHHTGVPHDISAGQIARENQYWLLQAARGGVSPLVRVGSARATLVSAPLAGREGVLLVAVVPVEQIDRQFLSKLGSGNHPLSAMLMDGHGGILAFSRPKLLIRHDGADLDNPELAEMARRFLEMGGSGRQSFDTPLAGEPIPLRPTITTLYPVHVGADRWWLAISSSLSYVDQVINRLFRQIIWWSIFVIVCLTALLVSSFVTVLRGRVRLERLRHEMLKHEVDQAREIQLAWLPARNQTIGRVDIAAANHPASHVSGDFYNWFELEDGRLAVCVGDVTGHGMAGAFLMATTRLMVRTEMLRLKDPGQAMEQVNRQLCAQAFSGQFVTLLILLLDLDAGLMLASTGGHYPPLISDGGDGGCFRPAKIHPQLILGVEPAMKYPTERMKLPVSLLLYTDGVLDAQAPDGKRYDRDRLERSLDKPPADARGMIDAVTTDLKQFCGPRPPADDLTLVAIRCLATGTNGKVAAEVAQAAQ